MHDIQNKKSNMRGQRKNRQQLARQGNRVQRDTLVVQRSLSQVSVPVHKFARTTSQSVPITPNTGFAGLNLFDLEMTFSLNQTQFYVGGVLYSNASNPGASDFTALYDFYRLDKVEVAIMYGANSFSPGPSTVAQLPILNIVFDPSDSSAISLSSILQYQNLHIVQMGNQRTQNGYTVTCAPRPLISAGGTQSAVEMNPWINKDTPGVAYYGIKMFYDNAGSTLATSIGNLTFYVKYHWSFKLSQ